MKVVKIIGIGVGIFVALLVIATIAVVALFDPNDYKGYVTDLAETNTGRRLTISEDLELSVFPWLAVETGGIVIGNAEGFGDTDFATIERVSARVRLIPLLSGRVEIGTVRVDGLTLNLATSAEGRTNWDDLLESTADAADAAPVTDEPGSLGDLNIEAITLRNARVVWHENTTETRYVVSELNLETGTITADRPLDVQLEMNVLDAVSQISGSIESDATLLLARDGSVELSDLDIGFAWRDAEAREQGSGRFTLAALSVPIAGLVEARGGELVAHLNESPLGPSSLDASATWAQVSVDRESVAIEARELAAEIGGIRTTWQLSSVPSGAGAATISGSLSGGGSATELLALLGTAPPAGLSAAQLGDFDVTGNFTYDTGTQRLETRNVGASVLGINVRADTLTLDESQTLTGTVTASGPVSGLLALQGIELPSGVTAAELGDFSASTSFGFDTQSGTLTSRATTASALGIDIRGSQLTIGDSATRGRVEIAPFRPSGTVRRVAAAYVPAEINVDALGRIALAANLTVGADQTSISGIEAELLGASLTGTINLAGNGSIMSGNIATNRFSPNELLAAFGAYLPETIDPSTAGTFALATSFRYDSSNNGSARLDQLRLEAFGLNATGQLTASDLSGAATYAGQASLAAFNPREVLGRFEMPIPQTSDDRALRRASVEMRFRLTPDTGTFENLTVQLDDSRITGSLTVRNFSDPSYEFQLAADTLDVDRYLPPTADEAEAGERTAGDIEISNEQLSALRINGAVQVGQLRLAGLDFQEVGTGIVVGEGRLRLDSARAKLYGGTFAGTFNADASTQTPSLLLEGRTAGVQLAPLLMALVGDASFSGTSDFDINLRGRGATITENLRSAGGTMGFSLTNGAIEGFNIDETLCRRYNQVSENPPPRENPPDRTPYQAIRGTATVTDGIARSNDLFARVGSFEVRGNGNLSIADAITDYKFEARLAASVPIPGCDTMDHMMNIDFPLVMTGPVTAPSIAPDYGEVVKRVIQDRVRDSVEDRLKDRLRDLLR